MYHIKLRYSAFILSILLSGFSSFSAACTTIMVGKNASSDGSIIIARLEDYSTNNHAKHFVIVPRKEYKEGDKLSFDNGVRIDAPKISLRYSAMRDWNGSHFGNGGEYSEFGSNEEGLVLSATNSTQPNDRVEKADPLIADGGGVVESILPDLILPQAKTAREAVQLLGKYVETLGAGETNGIQLVDANEAWLFEIGSGHHWIAVRLPDDGYFNMSNGMRIQDVNLSDAQNVMTSKGLLEFVNQHQLLDNLDAKRFNFAKAFGQIGDPYNVDREWLVQSKLTPSMKQAVREQQYPFYTKADKKIDVASIANILRLDGYQGTPLEGKEGLRSIATERNIEAHIIQVRPYMPKELQVLSWQSLGNVRDSVFLPFYLNVLTNTPKIFQQGKDSYDPQSAWWSFRGVTGLANANPEKYRPIIHEWRNKIEASLYANQSGIDKMLKELYAQDRNAAISSAERLSVGGALWAINQAQELFSNLVTDMTRSTEPKYTPEELEKIKAL